MIDIPKTLKEVPEKGGIYLISDREATVIYVGRSRNLKESLKRHLVSGVSGRDKLIRQNMAEFNHEVIEDILEATRRQLEMIQKYYPPLNGRREGVKQYRFIKIFHTETFPRARKKKIIEDHDVDLLGPFPKSRHIQKVLRIAANYYGIADCAKEVILGDDHKIVRTCIRRQTKQCMRPCEVEVDEEVYQAALKRFGEFFRGERQDLIDSLMEEMKTAAGEKNYEKAAKIRDELQSIKKIGLTYH